MAGRLAAAAAAASGCRVFTPFWIGVGVTDDPDGDGQISAEEGEGVDDLIVLTHLHEPAILYTLQQRYNKDVIYTYTGPILLAINPFWRVPL